MSRSFLVAASVVVAGACTLQRAQPGMSPAMDDHMAHMSAADLTPREAAASTSQGTPGLPASAMSAEARLKAQSAPRRVGQDRVGAGLVRFAHGVGRLPEERREGAGRRRGA